MATAKSSITESLVHHVSGQAALAQTKAKVAEVAEVEATRDYKNARYLRVFRHSQWLAMTSRAHTKPLLASRLARGYVAAKEGEQALKKILNAKKEALEEAKGGYNRLLKDLAILAEALADA